MKSPLIKEMDTRILVDEVEAVMGKASMDWHRQFGEPVGIYISAWLPPEAERRFLMEFHWLAGKAFGNNATGRK